MPGHAFCRHGLARKEVITLIVVGVVVLGVGLPLLIFRGPGHKTTCRAHLDTLSKALASYAAENKGLFPLVSHAAAIEPGKGAVTYAPGRIGRYRDSAPPADGMELSTTLNMYTLIRLGRATPADFICPSADDKKNEDPNPQSKWDFARYTDVSYGYQVPYGTKGQPRSQSDASMALMADKGPYGAALEANKTNPGTPTADRKGKDKEWKPWNNVNHKKEQNILHAGGHVSENKNPLAGVDKDNIYTRWSDLAKVAANDPLARVYGTPPTSNETPLGDTDSLIYP